MVMPNQQPGGESQMAKALQSALGLPSPDKVMYELQRLNTNIEMIQPDIHRLAQSLEGITGPDIRNLTAALNQIRTGDLMRGLNEFNLLAKDLYEKLWGKK